MADLKKVARDRIDQHAEELHALSQAIWRTPELNFQEHFAHTLLTKFLEEKGFQVERSFKLDTAFRATWGGETTSGPNVAVLCEYDALPEIGHGCGHNLIAEAGIAAGLGIKAAMETAGKPLGKLTVLGTPAEEGGGGKIELINKDVFKDVDVAMMVHPIIIKNGGAKANIIPDFAELELIIRAETDADLKVLKDKLYNNFHAAASATGCSVEIIPEAVQYSAMVINSSLIKAYEANAADLDIQFEPVRADVPRGSTDMGNVSHVVPSIHPMYSVGRNALNHTREFTEASDEEDGDDLTGRKSANFERGGCKDRGTGFTVIKATHPVWEQLLNLRTNVNSKDGMRLLYKSLLLLAASLRMKLHRRVLTFWLVLVTLGGWTVLSRQNISCNKNKTLSVIGLFGKTGQYDIGDISEHGAQLAVNDINSRKDILPGYKIALLAEDTKSDVSTGMEKLLYHLFECPTKVMVLGASTSYVTTYTAAVSRRWNLVQISFSATDPALSNKSKFPWFFRTSLSTEVYSQAFIKLMQNFQWFNFSVIQESYRLFTSTEETMKRYLNNTDITINTVETFDNDLENAIAKLKSKDARIIYVAAFENKARQAVCAAFRNNFYGPRRVWILQGYYSNRWYEINDTKCSASEILQVIDGYFTIAPSHYHGNDTVSKMSISDVYCRYKTLRNQSCDPHYKDNSVDDLQGLHYMPLAYDAMWAVALALHKTLTDLKASGSGGLENFTYNNTKLAEKIYENMQNVSFKGISGDIAFSPKGERVATVSVFQFQQNSGGQFVAIGRQKRSDMEIEWNNTRVYWPKGKPVSVRPTKKRLIPLPKEKYIVMCSLAALGMLTSAIFLTFNIAYRNVRQANTRTHARTHTFFLSKDCCLVVPA
ncbi:hypothetical protein C0Q70_10523 [Pomacea canaliculata]|uniref:Gamma-aminobutyric acid type B receptor subunit 2 n=1 Tax=Pomacea canaliculata TaxID=400727 RepID=A0A2T7P3E5_POMCA|nr:hypothetical protein C0Q70_10523 [Pomacea canaliculata]